MKVEKISGEESFAAALAAEPLAGVGLEVGFKRRLLVELFAALLALVFLVAGVDKGVPLKAGRVGNRLGALLPT